LSELRQIIELNWRGDDHPSLELVSHFGTRRLLADRYDMRLTVQEPEPYGGGSKHGWNAMARVCCEAWLRPPMIRAHQASLLSRISCTGQLIADRDVQVAETLGDVCLAPASRTIAGARCDGAHRVLRARVARDAQDDRARLSTTIAIQPHQHFADASYG
jgi:hypothetical protein